MPGQRLPVEEHHEIGQLALVVAVAADLAHQVHAHGIAAEREEQAVAQRQDAGVAPDQVHRQRADRVAHDLADQRHRVVAHVEDAAGRHHEVQQRRQRADHQQRDDEGGPAGAGEDGRAAREHQCRSLSRWRGGLGWGRGRVAALIPALPQRGRVPACSVSSGGSTALMLPRSGPSSRRCPAAASG